MQDEEKQAKSFAFYRSFYEAAEDMTDEERTEFFIGIIEYAFGNKELKSSKREVRSCFKMAKPNIDKSLSNSRNGKVGADSKQKGNNDE